jgi:hypothetical protein
MSFGMQEPMEEEAVKPEHHGFMAAHHTKMAKLHHGIGKMHEMAAAHHSQMAGGSEGGAEGLDDEGGETAESEMPMSFGRGAR